MDEAAPLGGEPGCDALRPARLRTTGPRSPLAECPLSHPFPCRRPGAMGRSPRDAKTGSSPRRPGRSKTAGRPRGSPWCKQRATRARRSRASPPRAAWMLSTTNRIRRREVPTPVLASSPTTGEGLGFRGVFGFMCAFESGRVECLCF